MQANREIKVCVCCEGRCNTHCPHKKNTREHYYPLEGNTQECNSKASMILNGLPVSLGQAQHKQIRHNGLILCKKWSLTPWQRSRTEYPTEMVGHMKAEFTGIADIANIEFWGQYWPIDTVKQINLCKWSISERRDYRTVSYLSMWCWLLKPKNGQTTLSDTNIPTKKYSWSKHVYRV